VARHALGTPSDDCNSVRSHLVSGSSAQLLWALNRLPESLRQGQSAKDLLGRQRQSAKELLDSQHQSAKELLGIPPW